MANFWQSLSLKKVSRLLLIGAALVSQGAFAADAYPARPIRIVVPTEPGGTVDFVARLLAQKLSEVWKTGVVVENRAGAGGIVGADYVAKAEPDGYTVAMVTTSFSTNAATNSKLPYDPIKDFTPVTMVSYSTYLLVCNPTLPVHSVQDLINLAKKEPGKINYGSAGTGGSLHLGTEMFDSMAGIKMTHIPYKGTAPAANAILSNEIQVTISSLVAGMQLVKAGKLRMLAVTSAHRSQLLPDLPAVAETVPGYKFDNWFGILAPRGTPKAVVDTLHAGFAKVLQMKDVREKMLAQSAEPAGLDSKEFSEMMRKEIADYSRLAKELNIKLD